MAFRDDREAQRARIDVLEADLATARDEADTARRERDAAVAERDEATQATPHQLLDEAVVERNRELEQAARAAKERERAARARTVGRRDRWMVAWNLRRAAHIGLLVLGGIGWLGLGPLAAALNREILILPGERLAMQWAFVACALAAVLGSALLLHSLRSLTRFRERLPFELEPAGWAKLVDQENFWIHEMWRHVVVSVEGGASSEVSAALQRLAEQADRTFYSAEDPTSDRRLRWKVEGRRARGSANARTAYALLEWCRRDLASIAGGGAEIHRVSLTVSDESVHVSRPSD